METGLKQLSDLFVEGAEANLGTRGDGTPLVIWVNKLNSFETEGVDRDAAVARALRMAELGDDSAETRGVRAEIAVWSDETLAKAIVSGDENQITLEAMNNLQTQEGWAELENVVRRGPELLSDESIQPGDPRFENMQEKLDEYMRRLDEESKRVAAEHAIELEGLGRAKLEAKFMEDWRTHRSSNEWMSARRLSELHQACRKCQATVETTLAGETLYDHRECDHSERYFTERDSVKKMPDGAMKILTQVYERLRIPLRDVGNSAAPASSSESLEPSSTSEEASTASTPEEMSVAAPTT